MAQVDLSAVKDAIYAAVQKAVEAGTLEEVTIGETRDTVEKKLGLKPGTLKSPEYKGTVKEMIATATEEIERAEEALPPAREISRGTKRKSAETKNGPRPTRKAMLQTAEKRTERSRKTESKSKRSPSVIPSDDEDDSEAQRTRGRSNSQPMKTVLEDPPNKRRRKVVSDNEEEDDGPELSITAQAVASTSAQTFNISAEDVEVRTSAHHDEKSDSEMSVLIDEPSKPRKKKSEERKPAKGRKKKAPAEELSKDDQQIKRLKSFVVACGIRKVWAKEFKDMDSKSAQIKHLKQILTNLGMNGRLSLEQAKAIKEKREFEQELEDVKQFERSVISGPRQGTSGRLADRKTRDTSEDEMSDIPVKPKTNARSQIMAFLGDQSDSD